MLMSDYVFDAYNVRQSLEKHPVFAALSIEELLKLCSFAKVKTFKKDETLIRESEPNDFLFLILNGFVDVKSYGVTIASCAKGALLGEVSTLELGDATAEIKAASEVNALVLPKGCIHELVREDPKFGECLYDSAMSRLLS